MTIRIYNTLTGKKEPLETIEPNHVKLYVCGITSYDYCHIGHARSSLAFDMIVKYLRSRDYKVTYIRNFTDIDDKIIKRANEQNTTSEELANRFIDEFYVDMDQLGIDRPTMEPKATEHIQEMVELISELIDKGIAYQAGNDVYFAVEKFAEYGKLSHRNLEDMQAGARISINELKHNPMDFVLWKGSKPGEPKWESPWGDGRPGWHIECSAMSRKYLGETFDIHGGGKDLIFPHHENELAQSEAANCCAFVKTWIHHGFVTIRDEKMSKSLNNFLTIRDLLAHYHPEILRFFVFSTHYRNPLDFSETAMQDATAGLERLYTCVRMIDELEGEGSTETEPIASDKDINKLQSMEKRFQQAMDNDFNTAQGQSILFDSVKILNRIAAALPDTPAASDLTLLRESREVMKKLAGIMGLLTEDAASFINNQKQKMLAGIDIDEATILQLIKERYTARKEKNWSRSDEIRDELLAHNIELKDGPEGTTWTVRRN
ncbi:cysteine--tRNA ligase [Desulfosediminicola sp.]|uniref:cysteine--tRNA ligase n=1 Tax=Desulfosediminicola sp. TaxID=2886825 RepID=UPI003AF26C96